MKVTVIIPMYNEEENVVKTISEVNTILKTYEDYEIIAVDDGSFDRTFERASIAASENPKVKVLKHSTNCGMGKALRTGFKKAEGDVIITIDADLSYDTSYIPKLIGALDGETDIVIGSQYMDGGKTEDIPKIRLFISKMANKIVGYAMGSNFSTVTGVFRAYKREVLDSIELDSNGTEINPEILSKANAIGFNINEVPVTLGNRKLGESKVKIKSTTISHLLFSFHEKPMMLFGAIGFILLFIGLISALYLFYQFIMGNLDPTRPLMLFMVLMILSGIQILIFGFVATQISLLKREVYIVQKENKFLRKKLK
ncbi:glycosyltransferase [Methanobacterium sp. MBAC-LM]|uniref:glycosyltransferase n=1 Tax=Methanobacterium sp. MBAC-LM TaxID=3412034 RepID=UPI003C720657